MIRVRLSAALAVRDGYTGKPIGRNTVRCFVDGQPFHPEYRDGGYLLLLNLAPGAHAVVLQGTRYREEQVPLTVPETGHIERNITLKPAPNYPFYHEMTQLSISLQEKGLPVKGRTLWVAAQAAMSDLKLAQDAVEAGSYEAKLFFRGGAEGRFPGNYLLVDGKKSEVVAILGAKEGQASFAAPLKYAHKRGVAFYPAQEYQTNQDGEILAFFREPVPVEIFDPEKASLEGMQLQKGKNQGELGKLPQEKA